MSKLKAFYAKYKHGIPVPIYVIFYLTWFSIIEKSVTKGYWVIHMDIDDVIPFCEVFIVPYLLWFLYIAVVVVYFFLTNKDDYFKTCMFLFTGMTIFLLISTLWPNGHHLRPVEMPRDNIFTALVSGLYNTDTPTNLWPSIHVYNSIGAHIAIMKSKALEHNRVVRIGSFILAGSIILSTMFLKQHSVFDVVTAFIMAAVMYVVVYKLDLVLAIRMMREKRKTRPQIS